MVMNKLQGIPVYLKEANVDAMISFIWSSNVFMYYIHMRVLFGKNGQAL